LSCCFPEHQLGKIRFSGGTSPLHYAVILSRVKNCLAIINQSNGNPENGWNGTQGGD
jgi:hypothetical protein